MLDPTALKLAINRLLELGISPDDITDLPIVNALIAGDVIVTIDVLLDGVPYPNFSVCYSPSANWKAVRESCLSLANT